MAETKVNPDIVGIQINEDVIISKAEISKNKESIEITFSKVNSKKPNLFEMSQQTKIIDSTGADCMVRLWSFKVPTFKDKATGGELSNAEKINSINNALTETKNQLIHILQRYLTTDDIKAFDIYFGTEVNGDNYEEEWLKNSTLLAMFENLANSFLEQLSPFIGNTELKSRLKLVRQKEDKPYPTLPGGKFLSDNPFFEPMEIPAEASKVKFSKYEINKGLANGEIPSKAEADQAPEATPETVKSVFGSR